MAQGPTPKELDEAFFMLARWIAAPAGTHGDVAGRTIRALRCLRLSTISDRASALIEMADDAPTLDRWHEMKVDRDGAEDHLVHLLDNRNRWLRECEDQLREMGVKPAHHR